MGLLLGYITRITRKHTLPIAMLSFAFGAILLILFSSNMVMLMIGAVFCGFSQGMFIPQAMCEITNAVDPISTDHGSRLLYLCHVYRSIDISDRIKHIISTDF